jgi:hypothetical protein
MDRAWLLELVRAWERAGYLGAYAEEAYEDKRLRNPDYRPPRTLSAETRHRFLRLIHERWSAANGGAVGIGTNNGGVPYGPFLDFCQELFTEAGVTPPLPRTIRLVITGH